MSTVKIKKVQAVDYIEIDMPEGTGGVRLFRGDNGAGKTTAIACVNALLGQKVSLSPSDDAPQGEIEGLGVKKTIGKTTRGLGEPEVANLHGRFDFSDLVDPPIKSPEARNKTRIRALVGLTAKPCKPTDFHGLFGGEEEFERIVVDEDGQFEQTTDVIEMADIVKRATEGIARLEEARLESAEMKWQTAVEQSKGQRPDQPPPSVSELAAKYSDAKNAHAGAIAQHDSARRAVEHNASMGQALEKHKARKPAKEPGDIAERLKSMKATVAELEKKLEVARQSVAIMQTQFNEAVEWQDRLLEIESSMLPVPKDMPSVDPLAKAEAEALQSLEQAEEVKQRYESAVRAKQFAEEIKTRREEAARLRKIAQRTNEVVTSKLPEGPLQVKDGVLSAFHEKRGKWIPYDELSEGERWKVALSIAANAVGPGGVIPVSQEAWQSLGTAARKAVVKHCEELQIYIISAEVADGPLRTEEYAPAE